MSRSEEDLGAGQSLEEDLQKSGEKIQQNGALHKAGIIRKRNEHMIKFMKEYRERQRLMETTKNKEDQNYEYMKEYMKEYGKIQRKMEMETSEEQKSRHIEDQQAKRENIRKIRKFHYMREYMKEYRKIQRMMETPEEKAVRLKKDRDSLRIKRQNKRLEMGLQNTKNYMKEYMAEYRNKERIMKTPEENEYEGRSTVVNENQQKTNGKKVGKREYGKVYVKEYRKRQRMKETPEEKKIRLAKERVNIRIRRQNKRLLETQNEDTKKHEEKLLRLSLLNKIRKHFSTKQNEEPLMKDAERKHLIDQKQIEMLILKQCNENDAVCVTDSLTKGQEKVSSQQKTLHKSDSKIENKIIQETEVEIIALQNQDSQQYKSESLLECPDIISVTDYKFDSIKNVSTIQKCSSNNNSNSSCMEDAFGGMRKVIDLKAMRDRYSIYGEHLANQIRNSGKSDKEIYIAKQLIDKVIKNLNLDDGTSEKHYKILTTQHVQFGDFKSEPMD